MKILLVIDQFDAANNGTTISAKRFATHLREYGNEVRVVSTGAPSEDKYVVAEWKSPIGEKLIKSQGMAFGKPGIEKRLTDSIENVLHLAEGLMIVDILTGSR